MPFTEPADRVDCTSRVAHVQRPAGPTVVGGVVATPVGRAGRRRRRTGGASRGQWRMLSARPWRSSNEPQPTRGEPSESLGTRRASTALRRLFGPPHSGSGATKTITRPATTRIYRIMINRAKRTQGPSRARRSSG